MATRIITLLLFISMFTSAAFSQASRKKEASSKREVQSQMGEATNDVKKELAELETQLKATTDPEEIKLLKEQIAILQKQLTMMRGLNKQLGKMSETVYQQAAEEETTTAPKRDLSRLSVLPKKTLTEAQLLLFLKKVNAGVENLIPPAEKAEALNIYNETKAKYNSVAVVANAANGCWMLGHWEKALLIMGRVCVDSVTDADNLNNYAAFLTMTGGEQAAIPILQYLNEKYPENSTILNNLGQAWYGMGELRTARKYLTAAIELYPTHSMANYTMSSITLIIGDSVTPTNLRPPLITGDSVTPTSLHPPSIISDSVTGNFPVGSIGSTFSDSVFGGGGSLSDSVFGGGSLSHFATHSDSVTSINYLKASLKESYDPEKEVELKRLGYDVKFADLPPLNYPMKSDPYGLIPMLKSWNPDLIQSSISEGSTALSLQRYLNGVQKLKEKLIDENVELERKLKIRSNKLSMDDSYREGFLAPHNCPGYLLAARSLQLYCFENGGDCFKECRFASPLITGLWLPIEQPRPDLDIFLTIPQILRDCDQLWYREVLQPLEVLGRQMSSSAGTNCADYDAKMNAYLAKRKEIYSNGVKLIQNEFIKNSDKLTTYIKYSLYGMPDDPPHSMNDLSDALISDVEARIARQALRNKDYDGILSLIKMANGFEERYRSSCETTHTPDPDPGEDDLVPLVNRRVECEYVKKIITPVRYEFALHCNTIVESTDAKLKKRKPNTQKGSGQSSRRRSPGTGPMQSPRGPNIALNETIADDAFSQKGPLTPEKKDLSQFSLEYNKWGNLTGFNFQLNDDGSALKDPDSIETGVDARWSWNAIGSPKRSYMYKLLMNNK